MLKLEEIQLDIGRAEDGDWMKMTHKPTGIFRLKLPPLGNSKTIPRELMLEIEAELLEKNRNTFKVIEF